MSAHNFYIFSNCDFSVKSAASTRMHYYAKALATKNHKVFLVSCCSTDFNEDMFVEIAPDIFLLENKIITRKPFSTLSFLRNLVKFSSTNGGEATFILYPYPFIFLEFFTVLYLIVSKKKRVFYELNEVRKYSSYYHDPISICRIKYSLKKIIYNPIYALLDRLLPYYKGLLCISTNIEVYGKRYNKNTLRIPILTDPDISIKHSKKISYSKINSFNIGFSGSIVPNKENLVSFVNVVNKLFEHKINVFFNLCGTITSDDCQLIFSDLNIHGIFKYYGNLDDDELSSFLDQQDLLVIPRGFSLQNNYGFSTKLSDYLNHQKVILITDISDNTLYIEDGVNGYVVPPDDENKMFEKLKFIIKNFEGTKTSVISNAYKTSRERFNFRLYGNDLRTFLKSN